MKSLKSLSIKSRTSHYRANTMEIFSVSLALSYFRKGTFAKFCIYTHLMLKVILKRATDCLLHQLFVNIIQWHLYSVSSSALK